MTRGGFSCPCWQGMPQEIFRDLTRMGHPATGVTGAEAGMVMRVCWWTITSPCSQCLMRSMRLPGGESVAILCHPGATMISLLHERVIAIVYQITHFKPNHRGIFSRTVSYT